MPAPVLRNIPLVLIIRDGWGENPHREHDAFNAVKLARTPVADMLDRSWPRTLIRTSGEKRLSNFLLWQSAYSELIFLDTLWPDFTRRELEDAIAEFQRRERRYGTTGG